MTGWRNIWLGKLHLRRIGLSLISRPVGVFLHTITCCCGIIMKRFPGKRLSYAVTAAVLGEVVSYAD